MNCRIEIETTLIADNGKKFRVGQDIAFTSFNQNTKTHERHIGEIRSILNDRIIITNIEINRRFIDGYREILLSNIEPNSCNYVSVS